jgi:hypothetical protein
MQDRLRLTPLPTRLLQNRLWMPDCPCRFRKPHLYNGRALASQTWCERILYQSTHEAEAMVGLVEAMVGLVEAMVGLVMGKVRPFGS